MNEPLVSIIAPCCNVSKTLPVYLDSVLKQTYKNIELVCVDDGSTDETAEILSEYEARFKAEGMGFRYIYQENGGLGAAIDTGLKHIRGDFLCWSDPDDFYFPQSVEKRLRILLENPEYAVVSSDAFVFSSEDLSNPLYREAQQFERRFEPEQFEHLLFERSHFCSGCHMVRMSAFERANPERSVYKARRGQNWQLLLPVYYRFKRYYLDEPLYGYVVYPGSMSSGDDTEQKQLLRWNEHEQIILRTLERIDMPDGERDGYSEKIKLRYALKRFYTAIDYSDRAQVKKEYELIEKLNGVTEDIRKKYLRNRYLICKLYFKIFERLSKND